MMPAEEGSTELHPPPYVVRPYTGEDLDGIARVEALTFPVVERYPPFFFSQAHSFARPGIAVAVCTKPTPEIVGYVVACQVSAEPRLGWVLSLAVSPPHRGNGLGRVLLDVAVDGLRRAGCDEGRLTADPTNTVAAALYASSGWVAGRTQSNYFGQDEDRAVYALRIEDSAELEVPADCRPPDPVPPAPAEPELIMGEAQSSLDFMNVLFTASLAVLALTVKTLAEKPVVALFLFIIVIASFYSAIFYAVVAGEVARHARFHDVDRAIRYGNVVSEYFAVHLLVVALPLVIQAIQPDGAIAFVALGVDLVGFAIYAGSGFSLVERAIPAAPARWCFNSLIVAATIALVVTDRLEADIIQWVIAGITVSSLAVLAWIHFRRGEAVRVLRQPAGA